MMPETEIGISSPGLLAFNFSMDYPEDVTVVERIVGLNI
jgi:hypothetical protein